MDYTQEVSMTICKASRDKESGEMRLRMVNSDTGEDVFGEKMSLELFEDFITRSDGDMKVPAPFDEVINEDGFWEGGAPYLSIAHFRSGAGKNVPGKQEKLYLDGEKLKSVDLLYDNDLGRAVWKSVYEDLYSEEKSFENPVRVSIGFLDLEHKHELEDGDVVFTRKSLEDKCELCAEGVGNKVYLKGHLVHKAFTRVPAHPRTDVEIEMKSKDGIITKEDDARSIIGDDIELENKSQVDDVLVVKADEVEESRDQEEVLEVTMDENVQEVPVVEEPEAEVIPEEVVVAEEVVPVPAPAPVVQEAKSKVDETIDAFQAKRRELKEKGITGDEALAELQPYFNEMGESVKEEVTPHGDIASVVRSTLKELLPSIVAEVVKQSGVSQQPAPIVAGIPTPRSVVVQRSDMTFTEQGRKQKDQFQLLAEKTTGLS